MAVSSGVAAAYSATAVAWQRGPGRIYDRLADVLVARSPVSLTGSRVVDVGAGTGAATRAVLAAGAASVVAIDAAVGMLAYDAHHRPPAVAGDALALPFAASCFDAAIAAFSLNHLTDPGSGLREMARVTRPGGALLAASYAGDDAHPVKAAVEAALAARGWAPESWYATLRDEAAPLMATLEGCAAVAQSAGVDAGIELVRVPLPDLDVQDMVSWRLGMAQHAPFLARLRPEDRDTILVDAVARLDRPVPPLVRSILVLRAVRS